MSLNIFVCVRIRNQILSRLTQKYANAKVQIPSNLRRQTTFAPKWNNPKFLTELQSEFPFSLFFIDLSLFTPASSPSEPLLLTDMRDWGNHHHYTMNKMRYFSSLIPFHGTKVHFVIWASPPLKSDLAESNISALWKE